MKAVWVVIVCMGMMIGQVSAQKQGTLKTTRDKISYSIGMNLGHNFKSQEIDVDFDLVLKGMKDAYAGGKMLLTPKEADETMNKFQADLGAKMTAKNKRLGEANLKEGTAFLAENKKKPGIVTLPSGLQYKILKAGTGKKPAATDTVIANYRGTLINGKEFDSSFKRGEPLTYPLNLLIKGWVEAFQLMPVGSKWQIFVPSDLGYGERGNGQEIGPNATLIFEIELLGIK